MDSKQLLISSINLLYLESLLPDHTNNSRELVKEIIDYIDLPDSALGGVTTSGSIIVDLKYIVDWMLSKEEGYCFEPTTILQKIESSPDKTEFIQKTLSSVVRPLDLNDNKDFEFTTKIINEVKADLSLYINNTKITEVYRKISRDLEFIKDPKKIKQKIQEAIVESEAFINKTDDTVSDIVDFVDLGDAGSVTNILQQALDDLNSGGVLKTDIKAFNDMFEGGLWPGKIYMGAALQHSFKSGMMMTLIRGVINSNKPKLDDKNKKPLILRISTENSARDDVMWFYKNLKENETLKEVDIKNIDPVVAGNYVQKWIKDSGWNFNNIKINPSDVTVGKIIQMITSIQRKGYEIKLLVIDYLSMLDKGGLSGGNESDRIRDMFRRMKNFVEANRIACLTPHQISSEGKGLKRADNIGVQSFVKEIANKGYTDGSKRIDQELDGDFYFDRTKKVIEGEIRWYLEIQRGKHRIPIVTEDKYLYTTLPFHRIGTIRPDTEDTDQRLSRPGAEYVPKFDDDEDF